MNRIDWRALAIIVAATAATHIVVAGLSGSIWLAMGCAFAVGVTLNLLGVRIMR